MALSSSNPIRARTMRLRFQSSARDSLEADSAIPKPKPTTASSAKGKTTAATKLETGHHRNPQANSSRNISLLHYQHYYTNPMLNSKRLVNLFKLMVIIAFVNYELMVNHKAARLAEAKSRGLIYNKDGKFIYRPAKSNQGHIIVIDDRHKDEKRDSSSAAGATNGAAESMFQPVQIISSRLYAAPNGAQLASIPVGGFPFAGSAAAASSGAAQLVQLNGAQSLIEPTVSSSAYQRASPSSGSLQMIPMIQLVEPIQLTRASGRQRLGSGLGYQLVQPGARMGPGSVLTAASVGHQLVAAGPLSDVVPLVKPQSAYESDTLVPMMLNMDQLLGPSQSTPIQAQPSGQVNQALDDSGSTMPISRATTAQSTVQLLPGSHQDFVRQLISPSSSLIPQQHYPSASPSSLPASRQFISHYDQSNRLENFDDMYDDQQEPVGSSRSATQQSAPSSTLLASLRRSKSIEANPLPGIMQNSNALGYRGPKSRFAESSLGLESSTGFEQTPAILDRAVKDVRRLYPIRHKATNATGEMRRTSLGINLDGIVDTDKDPRSSRYWDQYRDQFEVMP